MSRIQSEPVKIDLDLLLYSSDLRNIKKSQLKKINNALKKKEINVVTYIIVCKKSIMLLNIFLGQRVKSLSITISEEEEEQKKIHFTKKECRQLFQKIKNTEVQDLKLTLELKFITSSFIKSLINDIENLPKMMSLIRIGFELDQSDDLKRCEIESFDVLDKLLKFECFALWVSKTTGKINTRFIFMRRHLVELEISSSQVHLALWFLIKENADDLLLYVVNVEDLENIVPLCLLNCENKETDLYVSLSKISKRRRGCFKALLAKRTEFEMTDSSEEHFPLNREEFFYLKSQRCFEGL